MIGLKGNQPGLWEDVSLYFVYFEHYSGELPCFVTQMKNHDRIEKREYRLLSNLSWQREDWIGLLAVGMATASVTKGEKTGVDTRYFLSSVANVERFSYAVRKHWAIENRLHWCLVVIFDEDSSGPRRIYPLNLNVLRKVALALCKNADFGRRVSIQKKRFIVSLNPKKLFAILFADF